MRKIWLVTTDHLEKELWFRDDEDFRVGMNYVAIQAACDPKVIVLAFILMSNHVHFVLKGTREEVEHFIRQFKHRYSKYMRNRWGAKEFLRGDGVQVKEIGLVDEGRERAVAYVQMNCVAANICSYPSHYPWGTGNCFFNLKKPVGMRLGNMSARARERLLRSNFDKLPLEWRVNQEGFIFPQEYVNVKEVEDLFRTPKRMSYFQDSSSKARKRLESDEHLPAFRDQVILAAMPDLYQNLFGKKSFITLTPNEQTECMRQVRFRFSADVNQIARVCGLSYAEAAQKMEGI